MAFYSDSVIDDRFMQGRIDSHNKVLYARHADQRKATFQRVLQTGSDFDKDIRSMLLRTSIIKHELSYKHPRRKRLWASTALVRECLNQNRQMTPVHTKWWWMKGIPNPKSWRIFGNQVLPVLCILIFSSIAVGRVEIVTDDARFFIDVFLVVVW